mgnify:CR=1 FL=1
MSRCPERLLSSVGELVELCRVQVTAQVAILSKYVEVCRSMSRCPERLLSSVGELVELCRVQVTAQVAIPGIFISGNRLIPILNIVHKNINNY